MIKAISEFFAKNKDIISGVTSILTVVIALVGFWATWDQISKTKKTIQAANTYQIQKDGRDLINTINAGKGLFEYMSGDNSLLTTKQAKIDIWNMNNFYLSVFRQSKAGGLSDEFAQRYQQDFCGFSQKKEILSLLTELETNKVLGESFTEMKKQWCP